MRYHKTFEEEMVLFYCKACERYSRSASCPRHGGANIIMIRANPTSEVRQSADPAPTPATQLHVHEVNAVTRPHTPEQSEKILRFRKSERMLHWAIAIPFMACWLTALILFVVYNPDPHRPLRSFFSLVHRISGISLIVLPLLVLVKGRKDLRLHLANITTAWLWSLNDIKWILLMGLAAISKRIVLPEQGKFNAAEKVNFMLVMVSLPIFAATGLMMILQDIPWAAWLLHGGMALLVTPTMLGHIYMATVNPDTKIGLKGMTTGYVDREWARHHYAVWYRERFGRSAVSQRDASGRIQPPDQRIYIHCPSCAKHLSVSWSWLLQRIFALTPLICPGCGARFAAITAVTDEEQLKRVREELDRRRNGSQSAA